MFMDSYRPVIEVSVIWNSIIARLRLDRKIRGKGVKKH